MAERHIEGAVRGGKGHYEGRCAAERPLKTWHQVKDLYMVSPTMNGPINGFPVEEMKMLLALHRRLVLDEMTEREKREWMIPSVVFLREEDLEEITD